MLFVKISATDGYVSPRIHAFASKENVETFKAMLQKGQKPGILVNCEIFEPKEGQEFLVVFMD